MSNCLELQYGVSFGKLDSSDWFEWQVWVDDEVFAVYERAKMLHQSLRHVPELREVLNKEYEEIEDELINDFIANEDEFVIECTGRGPVDPDDINELVAQRDSHTLEFFSLTELSEEELDEWDADDLSELPDICEFEEDFEPCNPFDSGWTLYVDYADQPDEEDLYEEEARETLGILFKEANGDYSVINDYIERCEDLFEGDGTLEELAKEVADELEIKDYCE